MPDFALPPGARRLPDLPHFKHRFEFRSDGGDKNYVISYEPAASRWTCSCPSCIYRGRGIDCKHLRRYSNHLIVPCELEPPVRKRQKKAAEIVLPEIIWTKRQIAQAALGFAD